MGKFCLLKNRMVETDMRLEMGSLGEIGLQLLPAVFSAPAEFLPNSLRH